MNLLEDFLQQTTDVVHGMKELLRRIASSPEDANDLAQLSSRAAALVSLSNHLNVVCYQGLYNMLRSCRAAIASAAAEFVAQDMEDLRVRLGVQTIPDDSQQVAEELVNVCRVLQSQCEMSVQRPTHYNVNMLDMQLQALSTQLALLQELGARQICAEDVDAMAAMVYAHAENKPVAV